MINHDKMEFLQKVPGNIKDYTTEELQRLYNFVSEKDVKPIVKDTRLADGLYYEINRELYITEVDDTTKDSCTGIAIVMGEKRLVVSLRDATAESTVLTQNKGGDEKYFITKCEDVVSDWSGKENTERLKELGLSFSLSDNEYIPSVGELYLIYLHKKRLNEMLEAVGGERIKDAWYWASTEDSPKNAWNVYLGLGGMNVNYKASVKDRVRLVSSMINI